MPFATPVPIVEILDGIHSGTYVLPSIQRGFVWKLGQIERLFDSIMRGYPIGSFLFWSVEEKLADDFKFYNFITNYHEWNAKNSTITQIPTGRGTVAILDGQQRLTALNIGMFGSHAERQPNKRKNNPNAYPKKHLYLNLADDPIDDDFEYFFRFLSDDKARAEEGSPDKWFLVSDIKKFQEIQSWVDELTRRHIGLEKVTLLDRLHRALFVTTNINYFIEKSQDPDKVLDIFVRVNSGGTTLSHSDLLLSMAINQWTERDAREEVLELVETIRKRPSGFEVSKDLVLKTGLVLINSPDVRFKVQNFTKTNMALMEKEWDSIETSILSTVQLLESFGLAEKTLSANSVIIPIAYYLKQRGLSQNYIESSKFSEDRDHIKKWVLRSLVKRGIWGSSLDQLLTKLRDVIKESGTKYFPSNEIYIAMSAMGKSLSCGPEEIDEILELEYGKERTFPVLAMLYPGMDLTKTFHEDHIYPRSRLTRKKLLAEGVRQEIAEDCYERRDQLPNLQLLQGTQNIEKRDKMPLEWLSTAFHTNDTRDQYRLANDLDLCPSSVVGFLEFFDARRERLRARLVESLGLTTH